MKQTREWPAELSMPLSPHSEKELNGSSSASNFVAVGEQLKRPIRQTSMLLLVSAMVGIMLAASLGAQVISVIGVVRTTAGAPVAGATVTVVSATAHQDRHTAFTRADGYFTLASVSPGLYTITVQLPGRSPTASSLLNVTNARILITVSDQNTLTIAAEQLAPAPMVPNTNASATANATGGEKLSSQSVSELPLNGRGFSTLLLLAAGTMTDVNGATNFTQQFAINGQRGVEAVFAMDGADISDPEMGGSTFTNFNVDAIQELQSSSGWMPAEIAEMRFSSFARGMYVCALRINSLNGRVPPNKPLLALAGHDRLQHHRTRRLQCWVSCPAQWTNSFIYRCSLCTQAFMEKYSSPIAE